MCQSNHFVRSASPKLKIEPLQDLKGILDSGNDLPFPDGLLINGQGWNGNKFTVDQGKLSEENC
jgi:hypothetical protein